MPPPSHLIDVTDNHEPGYHPLMHYENWRVAVFNQDPARNLDTLSYLEYHGLTDEVFVLLQGRCALIVAEGSDKPGEIHVTEMGPNTCYNIRKGVWHALILQDQGIVLIVENQDTSRDNSGYYTLTEQDKAAIRAKVEAVLA